MDSLSARKERTSGHSARTEAGPAGLSGRSGGRRAAGRGDRDVPGLAAVRSALDRAEVVERHRGHGQALRGPGGGRVCAAGPAVPGGALVAGEIVVEEW